MDRDTGDTPLHEPPRWPHSTGITPATCLRLLCLAAGEPAWLPWSVPLEAAGWSEQQLRWVASPAAAFGLMREEGFDCLLLSAHEGRPELSVRALIDFAQALRAGGHEEGLLLVAPGLSDAEWAELLEVDCEVVVTSRSWDCPVVVPAIRRAARRATLLRENQQLSTAQRRRLVRERDEASQLMTQQWRMIEELQTLSSSVAASDGSHDSPANRPRLSDAGGDGQAAPSFLDRLPADVAPYYHELLRIYVIMGSGSLGHEIAQLAERLAGADLTPREVLELHLERVESLVRRLGSRSARHVLARADLLALEVMMYLGACYQGRGADLPSDPRDPSSPVVEAVQQRQQTPAA
jgi:hypothetical protein